MNLWNIEPEKSRRRFQGILGCGGIGSARIPRRVVIEVEERRPKAIVAVGKLYYVDADGVLFKK